MALKLDDLLIKKKEPVQILDLSNSTANSKEELKKLLEKVPEFKIKIEKVNPEDIKIHESKFTFKTPKKELKRKPFIFTNPVPTEMKSLCLNDLCSIGIQWEMLTSLRPKSKLDEEYFSRLVELGKLQLATRKAEKRIPLTSYVRKSKNRAGVHETKIRSCCYCGEEFCSGETCRQFAYELYERINITEPSTNLPSQNSTTNGKHRRRRRPKKRKTLKKKKKLTSGKKNPKTAIANAEVKKNLQRGQKAGVLKATINSQKTKKQSILASKIRKRQAVAIESIKQMQNVLKNVNTSIKKPTKVPTHQYAPMGKSIPKHSGRKAMKKKRK